MTAAAGLMQCCRVCLWPCADPSDINSDWGVTPLAALPRVMRLLLSTMAKTCASQYLLLVSLVMCIPESGNSLNCGGGLAGQPTKHCTGDISLKSTQVLDPWCTRRGSALMDRSYGEEGPLERLHGTGCWSQSRRKVAVDNESVGRPCLVLGALSFET